MPVAAVLREAVTQVTGNRRVRSERPDQFSQGHSRWSVPARGPLPAAVPVAGGGAGDFERLPQLP